MDRRPLRRTLSALLIALATLLLAAAPAAQAEADWRALSTEMAAPWPSLQHRSGSFSDYVNSRRRPGRFPAYGEGMLGYGLLQVALRENNRALAHSALRAIGGVARARRRVDPESVFENLALAAAYNLARRQLRNDPVFRSVRSVWQERLRRIGFVWFGSGRRYFNKYLVEAVSILELLKTGVRSRVRGALLAHRRTARHAAFRLLNRDVGAAVEVSRSSADAMEAGVLSDPPENPVAYHALSLGMLGRAAKLLGGRASGALRRTLRQVANASWLSAAPDGDLAYFGRSQEQAWTLSLAAGGAEMAARLAPADGDRYRALSRSAIARLGSEYGIGPRGLWITPAVRTDLNSGRRGLDSYANATSYGGLTLVTLNWALAARTSGGTGTLASEATFSHVLSRGKSQFAVMRTGDSWFAVKRALSRPGDLRYDFGLVAFKARSGDRWQDVVRPRPMTHAGADGAGPVLVNGRQRGYPIGRRMRIEGGNTIVVSGAFATARGGVIRPATFRYRAERSCVTLSFTAGAGERFEHSTFLPDASRFSDSSLGGGSTKVDFSTPVDLGFDRGYASGADPDLVRARAMISPEAGPVEIATCAR